MFNTTTTRLMDLYPGRPRWSGTRKINLLISYNTHFLSLLAVYNI